MASALMPRVVELTMIAAPGRGAGKVSAYSLDVAWMSIAGSRIRSAGMGSVCRIWRSVQRDTFSGEEPVYRWDARRRSARAIKRADSITTAGVVTALVDSVRATTTVMTEPTAGRADVSSLAVAERIVTVLIQRDVFTEYV